MKSCSLARITSICRFESNIGIRLKSFVQKNQINEEKLQLTTENTEVTTLMSEWIQNLKKRSSVPGNIRVNIIYRNVHTLSHYSHAKRKL